MKNISGTIHPFIGHNAFVRPDLIAALGNVNEHSEEIEEAICANEEA